MRESRYVHSSIWLSSCWKFILEIKCAKAQHREEESWCNLIAWFQQVCVWARVCMNVNVCECVYVCVINGTPTSRCVEGSFQLQPLASIQGRPWWHPSAPTPSTKAVSTSITSSSCSQKSWGCVSVCTGILKLLFKNVFYRFTGTFWSPLCGYWLHDNISLSRTQTSFM